MIVSCPQCSTTFNLPDTLAKPNAKVRCSVCAHVFLLSHEEKHKAQNETIPSAASSRQSLYDLDDVPPPSFSDSGSKKRSKFVYVGIFILLLALSGGGFTGWKMYSQYKAEQEALASIPLEKKVEKLALRNVRQYYVNNEKLGQIFVIEGKVVNEFPSPKDLVELEGTLFGPDKKPLVSKKQYAGTALSLFQLQVLGEKELENALANKIDILANNTNIPTGAEVPFMILFYKPPQNVELFHVKIVDVRDPVK